MSRSAIGEVRNSKQVIGSLKDARNARKAKKQEVSEVFDLEEPQSNSNDW
jgi:hypothetical protein